MARNRKYQSAAIRFGPAVKALVLCLLVGGSGVGYVWQKNQIYELGRQTTARESRLAALEESNEQLRKQLWNMRNPSALLNQTKALGLVAPAPTQIWKLTEPAREPIKSAEEKPDHLNMALR